MHRNKKLVIALAATAIAALVTGSLVQANSSDSNDLRRRLIPSAQHPAGPLGEQTLREFGQAPLPVPWGMVWSPPACQNFLEQAAPALYQADGYIRFSEARNDPDFEHDNSYIDMVAQTPVNLSLVRQSALSCANGTLTLEGKVTGSVRISQTGSSSNSLSLRISLTFPPTSDPEAQEIMAKFGYGSAVGAGAQAIAAVGFGKSLFQTLVQSAGVFFTAMSPNSSITSQAVSYFFQSGPSPAPSQSSPPQSPPTSPSPTYSPPTSSAPSAAPSATHS